MEEILIQLCPHVRLIYPCTCNFSSENFPPSVGGYFGVFFLFYSWGEGGEGGRRYLVSLGYSVSSGESYGEALNVMIPPLKVFTRRRTC